MTTRLGPRAGRFLHFTVILFLAAICAQAVRAAPFASLVMDARTGEVLEATNADTRLHPASLTKMMTLYIAFEAIKKGEITLDTEVTISAHAASEPPSRLGLKAGQKIKLRYLIRAAAIKSANDAATAIGEAIEGSEAAFARRMNRTATALGMTRTTFKNAHGLTEEGHLSTARDMTILGRRLFYDYPDYYNLFSRRTSEADGRTVSNTNVRFLDNYKGADGIKTGYTVAAGYNLTASAEQGSKRIIATVFGAQSTPRRNSKMAELLDLGFRKAPSVAAVRKPPPPVYRDDAPQSAPGTGVAEAAGDGATAKVVRLSGAVQRSIRPMPRPVPAAPEMPDELLLAMQTGIEDLLLAALAEEAGPVAPVETVAEAVELAAVRPDAAAEPELEIALAELEPEPEPVVVEVARLAFSPEIFEPIPDMPEVVTRFSTAGGRNWGINVGTFTSQHEAEKALLKTALQEIGTLDEALRKVAKTKKGFEANFLGMTPEMADLACRRLAARGASCSAIGPG